VEEELGCGLALREPLRHSLVEIPCLGEFLLLLEEGADHNRHFHGFCLPGKSFENGVRNGWPLRIPLLHKDASPGAGRSGPPAHWGTDGDLLEHGRCTQRSPAVSFPSASFREERRYRSFARASPSTRPRNSKGRSKTRSVPLQHHPESADSAVSASLRGLRRCGGPAPLDLRRYATRAFLFRADRKTLDARSPREADFSEDALPGVAGPRLPRPRRTSPSFRTQRSSFPRTGRPPLPGGVRPLLCHQLLEEQHPPSRSRPEERDGPLQAKFPSSPDVSSPFI